MKQNRNKIMMFFAALLIIASCKESSFMENTPPDYHVAPSGLKYSSVMNAREYEKIKSNVPTVNSGGIPCFFEILSVKNDAGVLGDEYLESVSIASAYLDTVHVEGVTEAGDTLIYDRPIIVPNNAGQISIENNDVFAHGDYYFTIEATTTKNGKSLSTVFEDAFHLNVMPELPSAVLYSPFNQNLVVGADMKTTEAYVPMRNPDVTFKLTSHEDKLVVDPETGAFSLNPSYTVTENETIQPSLTLISNISGEAVIFDEGFLNIVISNEPVDLPKMQFNFFYPSMLSGNNTVNGYLKYTFDQGDTPNNVIWKAEKASPLAAPERPAEVTGNKSLSLLNIVWNQSNKAEPMTSWMVMNSQNLSQYSYGYDINAMFYLKHSMLFYMADGRTPCDIEIYITDSFTGDVATTTWTQVNDLVKCEVNGSGVEFTGTPYPGDNLGDDPDGLKDPTKSYLGTWMRCELDLEPYKDMANFTLAFKYATYFDDPLSGGPTGGEGQAGKFWISDVNYKAVEK
ncbi:hypothetical protein E9993_00425 [Labilibacter sediminis]|nr:hypothetical protein E9993_00425 [Labilibacter sediminis]